MVTGLEFIPLAQLLVQGGERIYHYFKEKYDSSKSLEDNLVLLKRNTKTLSAIKKDWEDEVKGHKRKTVTHCYSHWKSRALNIITEAENFARNLENKIPSKRHFRKRSDLNEETGKKYNKVLELLQQSVFPKGILVDKPIEPVLKLNAPNVQGFPTLEGPLKQILGLLKNDKIETIGICGMVGVGKTTIMQNLNNHEEAATQFDVVIWLTVGSDWNEKKLQRLIAQRLKVNLEGVTDPVEEILDELKSRRYLLLLDEVMNHLNLVTMGIPNCTNGSKVILTTNIPGVCKSMVERVIEVDPLSGGEAWKMFREIVTGVIDLPDIEPVARIVVNRCARLPLLITKIASYFKLKNRVSLWRYALEELELWPQRKFDGLQEMYEFLKVCYDDLQEEDRKKCFMYCTLYPAESKIYTDYLVECWACQGFLGNIDHSRKYQNVRDKGDTILEHLIDVSLLQKGERMIYVWMNSCIRQVGLHILSSESETKFLIKDGENTLGSAQHWHEAKRISMIGSILNNLPESADYSKLLTLLLQRNSELTTIAESFFANMGNLLVLDLCNSGVVALPSTISKLTRLKGLYLNGCRQLIRFPPIEENLPLEVLDIRNSGLPFFPPNLGQLIHLRCLRMSCDGQVDDKRNGEKFCKVISKLTRLEELIIDTYVIPYPLWCNDVIEQVVTFKKLITLRMCFSRLDSLYHFLTSQLWIARQITSFRFFIGCQTSKHPEILQFFEYKILRYVKYCDGGCDSIICNLLTHTLVLELIRHNIKKLSDFAGIASMNEMRGFLISECNEIITILDGNSTNGAILPKLEQLYLRNLPNLVSIFVGSFSGKLLSRLQILELKSCKKLTNIFSDGVFQQLVELQKLTVEECPEIEELITGSNLSHVLPKLETLTLRNMPKLKAIYADKSLTWQSLEVVKIYGCPELKTLPFSGDNATNLRAIDGEQQWWDQLQESNDIKKNLEKICSLRGRGCQELRLPVSALKWVGDAIASACKGKSDVGRDQWWKGDGRIFEIGVRRRNGQRGMFMEELQEVGEFQCISLIYIDVDGDWLEFARILREKGDGHREPKKSFVRHQNFLYGLEKKQQRNGREEC